MATLRPGESLEHLLTDDDRQCMEMATDAEARGDAWAAWHHHVSGLLVEESLTHHRLLELARLEDDAPAWMCSRWAVDQALRWMLLTDDPRCDQLVRTVMAGLHFDQVESLLDDPVGLVEYGTRVAACDWVYQQLAAYEAGGLRDFLDARAEPGLLDRLDHIDEWERAAVTAYELVDVQGDVLRARRLDDDEPVELLNLGATTDIGPGATVVGRVVPVSVWPFAMFESRPLPVDDVTARDVAERMRADDDDLGWFRALAAAHDSGRLPAGSTCGHGTLWSTDIVPMAQWATNEENQHLVEGAGEEAGRVTELKAAGLSDRVANDVCVAELGLVVARVTGDAGPIAPARHRSDDGPTCLRGAEAAQHARRERAVLAHPGGGDAFPRPRPVHAAGGAQRGAGCLDGRCHAVSTNDEVGRVPGRRHQSSVGLVAPLHPLARSVRRLAERLVPTDQALAAYVVGEVDVPALGQQRAYVLPAAVGAAAGSCPR